MAIYYLSSVDGTDGGADGDGSTWDKAFATFKYAVETASAAAGGPHLLYVDSAHSESLSADTTITAAGDLRVLCVNRASSNALTTGAVVGAQATNYSITLTGAFEVYVYGIEFKNGTNTSATKNLIVGTADGLHWEFENCTFTLNGQFNSVIQLAWIASQTTNSFVRLKNCTCAMLEYRQYIQAGNKLVIEGGTISNSSSSAETNAILPYGQAFISLEGVDLSTITGTVVGNTLNAGQNVYLCNCKLGSGVTIKAAAATVLNKGNCAVWAFNCDAGDNHYALYHGDAFGETTVSTSVYANDGASYDGTNRCSWKIVTTANCSYYTPYVSPWMDVYHSGTSEISPYLEILRSGSTTKYQDDEVWGEFSYQGTSGSTKATLVNDRMTPLGTAADQTASSLDASGWTGEDATNNAFMKLEAGSITPAEIGHIRARVCVGEPSITVYVDPQVRGLS